MDLIKVSSKLRENDLCHATKICSILSISFLFCLVLWFLQIIMHREKAKFSQKQPSVTMFFQGLATDLPLTFHLMFFI